MTAGLFDTPDDRNENIEILRALAIVFVMVVHLGAVMVFPSASYTRLVSLFDFSIGVDLFFVISGYVITGSFLKSRAKTQADALSLAVSFWIKRIFRLLPAAITGLLLLVLFLILKMATFGAAADFREFFPVGIAMANIANLYSAYCAVHTAENYWCMIPSYCYIGHYWSLSLEQQFYVIAPLALLFIKKRFLVAALLVVIALSFFWLRPYWSYGWFLRMDGFCWGMLLALVPFHQFSVGGLDRLLNRKYFARGVTILLLAALPFVSSRLQGFGSAAAMSGVSVVAAISAALVFLAIRYNRGFPDSLALRRILLYVGSRSYALYIFHLMVFHMTAKAWQYLFSAMRFTPAGERMINGLMIVLSVAATAVLSELVYRYVEHTYRVKGRHLAQRFIAWRQKGVLHA